MKKLLFVTMVMMITSTTFSQHIGKAYIGLSLDETIKQCKEVGYELVVKDDDYAKFLIPNNNELYDLDIRLIMYASPKSKTVWFGTMTFDANNKKEAKLTFLSIAKSIKEKLGDAYEKRRKCFKWDVGHAFVIVERDKNFRVKYTVISPGRFNKIESEY